MTINYLKFCSVAMFWFCAAIFSTFAAPLELNPNDALAFDFDAINTASENDDLSHLDVYFKVNYDELQFIKADNHFRATYEIIVTILDKSGTPVDVRDKREEIVTEQIDDIQSIRKSNLSKLTFDLPPAKYEMAMSLQDLETQQISSRKRDVTLKNFSGKHLQASDILYLDYLSEDRDGNFNFTPKVSGNKLDDSRLYAYFEIYNVPETDSLHVVYEIIDPKSDKAVLDEPTEYWLRSGGRITKSYIEIAGNNLPHGSYSTRIKVDLAKQSVSLQRPFEWLWEGLPSSFANLDEAIESLVYISAEDDLDKLKKRPAAEKHMAYLEFWEKRDPTPGTSQNELQREYYDRVKYANENFYGYRKPGWKTDMGWAYVKLGAPDSIDRNPFNQRFAEMPGRTIKGFEVWTYYRYNRQLFFVDENGFGEYRLDNPDALYEMLK